MAIVDQTAQIQLTPPAADAVRDIITKRNLEGYALRVYISGGGCSGFQYGMALEGNIRDTDYLFEQEGVQMVIDEVSIDYLRGATIDFVDDIMGSGFKISNPNAISTCGCGHSFRTAEGDETEAEGGGCSSCH
jgi:iron-sulfur cluster assembly protein